MTYIPDGEPFIAWFGTPPAEGLTAVGWLDAGEPFARGDVPPEFLEELRRLCRDPVNRTRGHHRCSFCPRVEAVRRQPYITVASADGDFAVGSAEIRATGRDGRMYASPNMIVHYVEVHGYRPPQEFVDAVLAARDTE